MLFPVRGPQTSPCLSKVQSTTLCCLLSPGVEKPSPFLLLLDTTPPPPPEDSCVIPTMESRDINVGNQEGNSTPQDLEDLEARQTDLKRGGNSCVVGLHIRLRQKTQRERENTLNLLQCRRYTLTPFLMGIRSDPCSNRISAPTLLRVHSIRKYVDIYTHSHHRRCPARVERKVACPLG